jgi:hypothetical protein
MQNHNFRGGIGGQRRDGCSSVEVSNDECSLKTSRAYDAGERAEQEISVFSGRMRSNQNGCPLYIYSTPIQDAFASRTDGNRCHPPKSDALQGEPV